MSIAYARTRCGCNGAWWTSLAARDIAAEGGSAARGAFVVVRDAGAVAMADALAARDIVVDARGDCLRICPDVVTRDDELVACAEALAAIMRGASPASARR